KSYDKVFCFRSFKYVENPDRAIAEMERVLSPGGTILLEVSNNSLQNLAAKSISKLVVKVMPDLPVDSKWRYFANANFFSPADIGKVLPKHNLKIVKDQPLFILPSVKMVSALILLDKILFLILPKRFFARSFLFLISR
ncbi:MAG: methyltransferase domain-containing protein, partial [Nitrospinae bacterium]|nr:methyltransferase domain-containing protein [Nitrospinota bacterium]